MWTIELWVFTKGWKPIRKFKDEAKAREFLNQLLPLELQLVWPNGRKQWYGQAMIPLE